MSSFKHLTSSVLEFDNGYAITFEPERTTGTVFCSLRYKGTGEPISKFMAKPGKGDGYYGYLSAEDFAEVLYRISKDEEVFPHERQH
jgi:hypothetical protein